VVGCRLLFNGSARALLSQPSVGPAALEEKLFYLRGGGVEKKEVLVVDRNLLR